MAKQGTLFETKQTHMSRSERLQQIVSALSGQGRGVQLSALQVARLCGMKKSEHFLGLLAELEKDGTIDVQWLETTNRLPVRAFSLKD